MNYQDGWILFDNDLNAFLNRNDYGVISGLSVSEQSTPSMGVTVSAGKCVIGGKIYSFSSTNVSLDAADSTNPRKDIIIVNSSGVITKVTGTPEAASPSGETGPETSSPKPPDIPSGALILAEVWVAAGASAIYNADITDRRILSWYSRTGPTYFVFKEGSYYKAIEGKTHRVRFDNTDFVTLLGTLRDQIVSDNVLDRASGIILLEPNTIYEAGSKFTFGNTSAQHQMHLSIGTIMGASYPVMLAAQIKSTMSSADYFIQIGDNSAGYNGNLYLQNINLKSDTDYPAKGIDVNRGKLHASYLRIYAYSSPALRYGYGSVWNTMRTAEIDCNSASGNTVLIDDFNYDTNNMQFYDVRFFARTSNMTTFNVASSSHLRDIHFFGGELGTISTATGVTLFKNSASYGYATFHSVWFEYGNYALDCSAGGPFTLVGCKKFGVTNNWTLGSGVKLNYMGLNGFGDTYTGYGTVTG